MLAAVVPLCACASDQRQLVGASRDLAKAVRQQDVSAVQARVLSGARGQVDVEGLLREGEIWSDQLRDPVGARPEAVIPLGDGEVLEGVWTDAGWRLVTDPTRFYGQSTPREALRSFVRASRLERWDVLVRLAPRRYRVGLSAEDLRLAWTEGEQGEALRAARDRLAAGLDGPLRADRDLAVLELSEGNKARLEREGDRWVVVDF